MTNETPEPTPPPNLHKAPADPPAAPTEPPASIWEPLDGSPPPALTPNFHQAGQAPASGQPGVSAWGQPHQGVPVPPAVAASAYAAAAAPGGAGVHTLAGWWQRVGAYLIDGIIFGLLGYLIALPVALAAGVTVEEAVTFFGNAAEPDSVADVTWLYVALIAQRLVMGLAMGLTTAKWNGQTPGKRAVGIRVMRADGDKMDTGTALKRELLARTILFDGPTLLFSAFAIIGLLNVLWPLWDPQRRAGHDAIARTRVVRAPN